MSDNKFDNLYAGFEHWIILLFLFTWNSLPSVYTVLDSGNVSLWPTLVIYDSFAWMRHLLIKQNLVKRFFTSFVYEYRYAATTVFVCNMLSTFFCRITWSRTCCINLDMSRLMQQVRWFVRVLDKWNEEKNLFQASQRTCWSWIFVTCFIIRAYDVIKWKKTLWKSLILHLKTL